MRPAVSTTLSLLLCGGLAMCALAQSGHQHGHDSSRGAHEHGVASLSLAIDHNTVAMLFETPAVNLLGFEHRPETMEDRRRLEGIVKRLQQATTLVAVPPQAGCTQVGVAINSDLLRSEGASSGRDEHADFDISYELRCSDISELSAITVTALDNFPGLERVKAQWFVGTIQNTKVLTRSQTTISLQE
jgi:hypothetical protein